ncbi:MAG TPA: hypothetical protein VIT44_02190, partial [Cyclobacteriaceae bacterium]
MKNDQLWKPTKFVESKGKLIASRDTKEVNISSRLGADLVAEFYQAEIPRHVKGKLLDLGCGKIPLYATYKSFITQHTCVDWGNTSHKNIFIDREVDLNKALPFNDQEF